MKFDFDDELFEKSLGDKMISINGYYDTYMNRLFFPDSGVKVFDSKDEKDDFEEGEVEIKKEKSRDILDFCFSQLLGWTPQNAMQHVTTEIIVKFRLENFIEYLTGIRKKKYGYSAEDIEEIISAVYPNVRKGYTLLDERFTEVYHGGQWSTNEAKTMRDHTSNTWMLFFENFLSNFSFSSSEELYAKFSDKEFIEDKIKKYKLEPLFDIVHYPVEILHTYLLGLDGDENTHIRPNNVIFTLYMIKNIDDHMKENENKVVSKRGRKPKAAAE